jgi:hypothetical protein
VVASLLVSGCTTSTTNQTPSTNATSSTAAAHDAFLEKSLATYKNLSYSDSNWSVRAWELTWINSTSALLQDTWLNKTTNVTEAWDETFIVFPTIQEATNYLNAMNMTAYSLASTEYTSGGVYQNVTGHAPQIYKEYVWNEGNPLDISAHKLHEIVQTDNIVFVSTKKVLGVVEGSG